VHNLAWKLAAVLKGWAAPELLDTYDAERRPWGQWVTDEALASAISMGRGQTLDGAASGPPQTARPEFHSELGVIFGASYDSLAVIPDGTDAPKLENPVSQYIPSAHPGARAPHVWFQRNGHRLPTHDLIGMGFALFAGERGATWRDAAREVSASLGVPLTAYTVGADADLHDPEGRWTAAYGVETDGAVLVRPDGHVAWRRRSAVSDPKRELEVTLRAVTGNGS
jgi:putative polyketide hydroxylase